jgi:hypothetical protein
MTTRLFNKVVTGTGPSRSVPAAAARLPSHHYNAIIGSFFCCNNVAAPFDSDTLRSCLTHKTLVLAITHLCCEALCTNRALMRATNNNCSIVEKLRVACQEGAAIVVRQLTTKLAGRSARLSLPCPALAPKMFTVPPLQLAWIRLHNVLGVKARIPNWVVEALPDAAATYQDCVQQPRQLSQPFAEKIGIAGSKWASAFEPATVRDFIKEIPVETKAAFYILVHAYNLRRSLVITSDFNGLSPYCATVCAECMSLRTQAHNLPVVKSKRSGIMLDVRRRQAMCADCHSDRLVRVPIGRRNITVRGSKADLPNTACGGCGRLCSLANVQGTRPYCKRCAPVNVTPQCFCRAPARCTVKLFLTIVDNQIVMKGACNRHVIFLPHSIEELTVVARRANVRI